MRDWQSQKTLQKLSCQSAGVWDRADQRIPTMHALTFWASGTTQRLCGCAETAAFRCCDPIAASTVQMAPGVQLRRRGRQLQPCQGGERTTGFTTPSGSPGPPQPWHGTSGYLKQGTNPKRVSLFPKA